MLGGCGRGAKEKFSKTGSKTGPSSALRANREGVMWTVLKFKHNLNFLKEEVRCCIGTSLDTE